MRTKNKQMANRDLLKEAIADAKAVKETAIANAKAALEEAFSPMLREKLAAKIAEMDEMDEEVDLKEADMEDLEENYEETNEAEEMDEMKMDMDEAEEKVDEVDLEELLRELDELEEGDDTMEERLGTINDPIGDYEHGNLAEAEEEEYEDEDADGVKDSEDEEIDLEGMDEGDLKKFIEDVIADMVASGELEAGEEMESEEGEEEIEMGMEMEGEEMMAEVKKAKKDAEEAKKAKSKAEKELKEAYNALESIKTELNEVNLFNAKLLYTNKIFKAKNLNESQKVKVLAAFDKAASVKEAKLVFETLSAGFNEKKAPMNESLIRGGASKPAGIVDKKPIMEANDQVARWQKLAGIKNNN